MPITRRTAVALTSLAPILCRAAEKGITKQSWGKLKSGQTVDSFKLTNTAGTELTVITYGARVQNLKCADKSGTVADIVLGYDSIEGYQTENPYFGAIVGRYGNRIAKGRFTLDGKEYKLAVNNGENALHGGLKGFDKVVWQAKELPGTNPAVELSYISKDGEEGYPGTLSATVRYSLNESSEIRIEYSATTDKKTVLNLTNHAYFNLAGQGVGDILGHRVQLFADRFTPVDAGLIPTGNLGQVAGTPFDFREPHPIGERIQADHEQIQRGKGYDHNFVVNGAMGTLRPAARVVEPVAGRVLEVSTTEPGVQFYTGNFLDGSNKGKGGKSYGFRSGFCLETQHFPDSPNQPAFPSTVLAPGSTFRSTTMWKLSVDR
ncbi:MAG: galactose mutarotase [Bryobacteraceae bacterium]|nr:galactose mutarotase [Bryobacteraceae bacterium]